MKLNRLGKILLIILALMLLINVVSAGDNTLVGTENGKLMMDSDSYALADNSDDGNFKLSATDSHETLKAGEVGNYTELQGLINSNPGGIITLDKNYAYSGPDDIVNITVSSSITINGNGHNISGENQAMSLYINNTASNVILNNITFVNGNTESMLYIDGNYCKINDCTFEENKGSYGGAVYIRGYKNIFDNCKFINNYASAYGGAIDIGGSYNSIYNSTFIGNSKPYAGGAVCLDGVKNLIHNCTFKDNTALYYGGAIDIYGKYNTIDNCTFDENTASYYAGAVYMESSNCLVNNSIFNHNSASYYGGAVHMASSDCIINGSKFYDNTASYCGGAVFMAASNGLVNNSDFSKNTADYYGGAVAVYNDNNVVDNSDFSENVVNYGSGAAVYVSGNNVKVSDSTFAKHNGDSGGAVYWIGSNGTVEGSKFNENTARNGGAICWEAVGGKIDDCEFTENSAVTYNGGAIYVTKPDLVIEKSKFTQNTANKDAGAVYINTNNVTVKDSEFYKNHANDKAGAVEIYGSNNTIDNSVFESNDAANDAGAVIIGYYFPDPEGSLNNTIRSSKFTKNKANGFGGAIRVDAQGNTIDNSEFYYNSATVGGGVSFNSKNNTIDNSKFEYNSAANEGGAVNLNTENLIINNTDLNYNNATHGGAVYVASFAKNAIVNNSNFVMNDAFANGGAICWDGADGTVDNSLFYNNIVDAGQDKAYGGAIKFTRANAKISNSNFTWNMIYNRYGSAEGGALSIDGKDSTVENCKFEYNYAESYAGAIHWKGTDGTIFNSEFINNTAVTQGGAINANGANLVINKSAFTNNSAFYLGGAVGLSVPATIDNSNFTLNHANKGGAVFWDSQTGLVNNSYFYKNHAYYAGGAFASDYMYDNGEKIIQNSLFEENNATNFGGAIASLHTQIVGSTFKNNDAHTGEALYSYLTSISDDSTFINNDVVLKPTELIKITPGDSIGNSTRKTNTTYLAMCVERYTSFPNVGIKDDSLERLVNVISGEPIADYLKILVYTYFNSKEDVFPHEDDEIYFYPEAYRDYENRWNYLVKIPRPDYFSRAVHEFSDHDFWNSDHPVVLKVLELYKTVYANGTKMPEKFIKEVNGTVIEYDFSSMISPTSQSLFLFDIINYKLDVDKIALNTTDVVYVNDTVAFNITVNNTADKPIINVTIDEIFNSTELEYIGHSNNKTWVKNGNTFTYTHVPDIGDIVVYSINLKNTGNCLVKDVKFNMNYNSTQLEYVKSVGGLTVRNGVNVIVYEFIPVEDDLTLEVWFKVLRNDTLSDVDFDVVDLVAIDGSPLLPLGEVKNPEVSIQYDKVGRFPAIPVGENTAFTIWFRALTNGTLVNNITFKANGFKDIVTSNYTDVYKPITINVTKVWDDNNNQDGIRPENITFVLMDDKGVVAEIVLNESNNWKGNFSNLPVVYVNKGALINYTVVEKLVPADYKAVTVKVDGYNYVINNTHVPSVT
jgi:predicted outer membrane repeat protein